MTHPEDEPSTTPGPTDEGGHGGMATRELEAAHHRAEREEQDDA